MAARTKKPRVTDITVVLDKSGSMWDTIDSTLEGFNGFLNAQQAADGVARMSLYLFHNSVDRVHDAVPVDVVPNLTRRTYSPGGGTALYDAIYKAVREARTRCEGENTINQVVILTDGEENSSRLYTASDIKYLISDLSEKGWQFIFLAANQDAILTAQTFGINQNHTMTYRSDAVGTRAVFNAMTRSTVAYAGAMNAGFTPDAALAASSFTEADRTAVS